MMSLLFGDLGDFVCECDSLDEILKFEHALQVFDVFTFDNVPLWDLRLVPDDLGISCRWFVAATGNTFQPDQIRHIYLTLVLS